MLLQSRNFLDHLTVADNLTLVQRIAGCTDRDDADPLLDELGIADRAAALPRTLSGGEAARSSQSR